MLPDIDSGPGRPLREITTFMAAVVPTMLFRRLLHLGMSHESIILIGAGVYVAIRFGLAWFLRLYTVHRGMFHSLVAAAIFGELTFLLACGDSTALRWFTAGGVVVGFLSHLLLDEVYSVQWDGRPRLKRSFGTALKFFAEGWWPNISAYAKFAVLTFLVLQEPSFMQQFDLRQVNQMVHKVADGLPDSLRWDRSPTPAAGPGQGEKLTEKAFWPWRVAKSNTKPQSNPGPQQTTQTPTATDAASPPAPLAWPSPPTTGEIEGPMRR
jgi:membrane-bound metal-dependent hydrolase YbcI (DUF457 family)